MNVYLSAKQVEGFPGGLDRLIDNRVGVRGADKSCLKLRGRQVNPFIQHRVEKLAVKFTVALVGRGPVCNWRASEETSPH